MHPDHRTGSRQFSIKDLLMATAVVAIGVWLLVTPLSGGWELLNLAAPVVIGVGLFLPFKRKFLGGSLGCLVVLILIALWLILFHP